MKVIDSHVDELLADSFQLTAYLKPKRGKIILEEDIHREVENYLQRYKESSARIQLQIFMFSGLYLWNLENYLQHYQ